MNLAYQPELTNPQYQENYDDYSNPQYQNYIPTGLNSTLLGQEGITKWLQNPKEIIKEIGRKLRGIEYNPKSKREERYREPLLSEEGINLILTTLDFHINRTVALSNIEEEMINNIALEIHIALASALQQNWVKAGLIKEYLPEMLRTPPGIRIVALRNNYIFIIRDKIILKVIIPNFNMGLYKLVLSNIDHIVYSNLRRAKDGGERNFLTKITTEQIQTIKRDVQSQQDSGIISKLLGTPKLFGK